NRSRKATADVKLAIPAEIQLVGIGQAAASWSDEVIDIGAGLAIVALHTARAPACNVEVIVTSNRQVLRLIQSAATRRDEGSHVGAGPVEGFDTKVVVVDGEELPARGARFWRKGPKCEDKYGQQ